jgi:hypothetical protein
MNIFGLLLIGRLGLFHLMKRILDTLNPRCALYWKAMVEFKASVYRYNDVDEANLIRQLKNGKMAKDGKCYSDLEIHQLQHSKRWKQRYQEYLRKIFHPPDTAKHRLVEWSNKFKDMKDSDGKSLFSRDTEKVALEQTKKIEYIQDLKEIDMYRELPPGPRSTHGLSRWLSSRPESALEKFHELLAHFGNTGMASGLSDCLTLRGTAEHNMRCRHKHRLQQTRLEGLASTIPQYLEDVPLFWNHSLLDYLNRMAVSQTLQPIFSNVRCLKPDNGEVFLSTYFREQEKRNRLYGQDAKLSKCKCPSCGAKSFPLVEESTSATPAQLPSRAAPAAVTPIAPAVAPTSKAAPPLPSRAAPPPPSTAAPPPPSRAAAVTQPPTRLSRTAPVQPSLPNTTAFHGVWTPTMPSTAVVQTNQFVPYPSIVLPKVCCYPSYPFYCNKFSSYLLRKHLNGGGGVYGRKPHDSNCSTQKKNGG